MLRSTGCTCGFNPRAPSLEELSKLTRKKQGLEKDGTICAQPTGNDQYHGLDRSDVYNQTQLTKKRGRYSVAPDHYTVEMQRFLDN